MQEQNASPINLMLLLVKKAQRHIPEGKQKCGFEPSC